MANNQIKFGANYNPTTKCVDFKLYSKNATKVLLCIFDKPQNDNPVIVLNMEKVGDVWSTSVRDYILNCHNKPVFYGYRVFGKNWEYDEKFEPSSNIGYKSKFDENGNRFNPNKIAFDPYARELSHTISETNQDVNIFRSGGNFHLVDNAKWAIKSVFFQKENVPIVEIKPRAFNSEIIGEVHIKDLTQSIPIPEHGTYLGAGKFAKNIKNLGITMVEFLPLNEFDSKQHGTNHWGYMPLAYFSLARKYAYNKNYGELLNEFRFMVNEFHKNDIKVCLDMVYNHTGEGGLADNNIYDANLLSYALIDNSSYYKVYKNGHYRSNSGCGNDFNIGNDEVFNLIADSLEFWVNQGVDAFRFDLAASFLDESMTCSEVYSTDNSPAQKLKAELLKRGIKVVSDFNSEQEGIVLIAEPWTCGGCNCYQLGNFPSFWAEWNDNFRNIVRKSTLRPYEITPKNLREIVEGNPAVFEGINKSVNYIASHDGFSLFDLNSFNRKSFSTQGGSDWEICGDYGGNSAKKENAIRKQLAFLFLSYGIPMIQIGDLLMHSKNGNNNSYNKDDETNYLNWQKITEENGFENRILEYARNLIKFRNEHSIFKSPNFKDFLTYHYDNGQIADDFNDGYWNNSHDLFFGYLINSPQARIYIATSKSEYNLRIFLPDNLKEKSWHVCSDSSIFKYLDLNIKDYIEKEYILNPHAMTIFMEM